MELIEGEVIGDIHIVVCKTPDGYNFFKLQADNENLLPMLDIIEDILVAY